jgi:hypothetical protein
LKNNLPTASSTYYRSMKKGSLNSIAMRIRAKLFKNMYISVGAV